MSLWDSGDIKWVSDTLTASFADNRVTGVVKNAGLVIYIDYTKGTEANGAEMLMEFDNSDRDHLGVEEWYSLTNDGMWSADSVGPLNGEATHDWITAKPVPWRFYATGKYRVFLNFHVSREKYVRCSVRAAGALGATPGTIGLRYCTDEIQYDMVGQGG